MERRALNRLSSARDAMKEVYDWAAELTTYNPIPEVYNSMVRLVRREELECLRRCCHLLLLMLNSSSWMQAWASASRYCSFMNGDEWIQGWDEGVDLHGSLDNDFTNDV